MKTIKDIKKTQSKKAVEELPDGDMQVVFPVTMKKKERQFFKVEAAKKGKSIASVCMKALIEEFGKPPFK